MAISATPDGIDIYDSWKTNITFAISSVWRELTKNPKKSILTESDLKCWLFRELDSIRKEKFEEIYSVNSEVTHYHGNAKEGVITKVYHFRDLSILFRDNIRLNSSIWKTSDKTFGKGFHHKGPAIHFELKLVREGKTSKYNPVVSVSDLNNFKSYHPPIPPNREFVTVWGSRSGSYLAPTMIETFKNGTKEASTRVKPLIQAYIFDKKSLYHGTYDPKEDEYIFIQLQ